MSSKQILRRIGLGLLTLWLVSLVVFAAVLALPGDAATAILGKTATPDRVSALREQLHLNDGIVTQYTQWLQGILTFDFGNGRTIITPAAIGVPLTPAAPVSPIITREGGYEGGGEGGEGGSAGHGG